MFVIVLRVLYDGGGGGGGGSGDCGDARRDFRHVVLQMTKSVTKAARGHYVLVVLPTMATATKLVIHMQHPLDYWTHMQSVGVSRKKIK